MSQQFHTNRKQKRNFKRVLVTGILFIGFAGLFIGIVLFVQIYQNAHNHYISPLASLPFLQNGTNNQHIILLKKELTKKRIQFTKVEKSKDSAYVITLKEGGIVTFSAQKDIMTQIASLQYILSHLTMEGKLFTRLDLRYEKPVIVLK